jgi:hypothetical protein
MYVCVVKTTHIVCVFVFVTYAFIMYRKICVVVCVCFGVEIERGGGA